MPHYKLIYFNSRGRAEVTRYLFALSKTPFEDVRLDQAEWAKLKPDTSFGILPILEIDGVQFCQSGAINRFLAREFGYYGSSSMEALRVDVIAECLSDCISELITAGWVLKDEAQVKAKEKLIRETLPKLVTFLEKELGSKQWLVGDKVSVADLGVLEFFSYAIPRMFPGGDYTFESEKLKSLISRVSSLPEIASHVANRPPEKA